MNIKFLLFADLHVDMMHDGVMRAQVIAEAAVRHRADFIMQLGDLMYPGEDVLPEKGLEVMRRVRPWALERMDERRDVWRLMDKTGLPVYSVLGNHDLHVCDKETACKWLRMPAPYYGFVRFGVRFLVLDTNFVHTDRGWEDLAYGSSAGVPNQLLRYVPGEQLKWLEETVLQSEEPCVLMSHASLCDALAGIQNREEVTALINRLNRDKRRVLASFSGHSHVDGMTVHGGVPYVNINSASYHWLGADYASVRYSEKLSSHYPRIKSTAPYAETLYAVVEITGEGMSITGRESIFVGRTPQELGLPESENDHQPSPRITSREIRW